MSEKIRVSEPLGFLRRLVGFLVSLPIVFGALFGWLIIINEPVLSGQMSWEVATVTGALMVAGVTFLLPWLAYLGRRKIAATPILFVKEGASAVTEFTAYWFFGIIGAMLFALFGRNKFALCDEGVVVYEFGGPTLYRWNRIKSFSADNVNHQFILKRSTFKKVTLTTSSKYQEVYRILSEHIPA